MDRYTTSNSLCPQNSLVPNEVPCAVAIRTAKSVIAEVPQAAESSIGALGRCDERNPERDVHKLTHKFKLSLPIPLTNIPVGDKQVPILRMSDWAQFILNMNLWHTLCGLEKRNEMRAARIWKCFWERYKVIHPNHPVYEQGIPLERTCALLLHGDEGRSLKKSPILCVSTHSILGYGLSTAQPAEKNKDLAMKLNYEQPTWTTRFLLSVMPRHIYEDDDGENLDAFQDLMGSLAQDMRRLSDEGLLGLDNKRYYFVVLNIMGDWPWMLKAGCLARTFHNAAKRATSRARPKGICHQCLADTDGYPWEDWANNHPRWMDTINCDSPFLRRPALLDLLHDESQGPMFFSWDLFHAWHLGAGKSFLASAVAILANSVLFDGNRDERLQAVSSAYSSWCKANRQNPTLKSFTMTNLSWIGNTFPAGTWSKGATTTCILKWFVSECQGRYNEVIQDELLMTVYKSARSMNEFLHGVYSYELWIPSAVASELAGKGMYFLKKFGKAVKLAVRASKLFFIQLPNYHRLQHIFLELHNQAQKGPHALNPLAWATQSDEDYIGRPSRISRRVDPRTTVERTLQRSLEAAYAKYVSAGRIVPEKAG